MIALFNKIISFLKTFDGFLERIEKFVLISILSFVIGLSFLQVILRNFFGSGFIWGDVFLRQMVLWIGLIGASIATKENRHINIDIVSRIIFSKAKFVINIFINIISAYVCLLLLKASFRFVASEKSFGTAVFENFPVWIFQTIFVITFCLMTFRFALNILDNIKSLLTKEKLN